MKYCYRYTNLIDRARYADVDEIAIIYTYELPELAKFLMEFPTNRVILCVDNIETFIQRKGWAGLGLLKEQAPSVNIAVKFATYEPARTTLREFTLEKKEALVELSKLNIDYFFACYAANWDELNALYTLGVSDIYIGEALGFELDKVAKFCHPKVLIRAYPNIAQSCVEAPPLMKFFIRPDDVELMEKYIDVFEFWGADAKQESFANIYRKGQWLGNLANIIEELNCPIDNLTLLPTFGAMRAKCGRKCLTGAKCSICSTTMSISQKLAEKHFAIRKKKSN